MNDPELEELFGDPADRAVVDLLKASRPAAPPLDPHFHNYLRAKLMTEARRTLPARAARSWLPFRLSPKTMAPAMAAVAAGFLVVLGVEIYLHGQTRAPEIAQANIGAINNKKDVGTGEPIVIPFTGPVDKTAVAESVVIQPATSVTTQWVGQNLVIIPAHPLAPNTTYSVTFKPTATAAPSATPTPAPQQTPATRQTPPVVAAPVVVHFTTVRPPVTPIVPPSFKSTSVAYGYDSRLADAGTILGASWTPGGPPSRAPRARLAEPVGERDSLRAAGTEGHDRRLADELARDSRPPARARRKLAGRLTLRPRCCGLADWRRQAGESWGLGPPGCPAGQPRNHRRHSRSGPGLDR
jgi:hypothetical protein